MLKNKKFLQTSLIAVVSCAAFIGSTPQSCRALTATTAWPLADDFMVKVRTASRPFVSFEPHNIRARQHVEDE